MCYPPPEPLAVTIEMSEYAFSPADIEVVVGQEITITLVNIGQLEHELMIGRKVEMHDGRPDGYVTDLFRLAGITPAVAGDGMLMAHGEEEHTEGEMNMEGEEHTEDEMNMDGEEPVEGEMEMEGEEHTEDMDVNLEGEGALMVMMPVGAGTTTVTFTITEEMLGDWEMGCFELEGVHYTAGMVGSFTVTN